MRNRVRIQTLLIDFDGVLRHWPQSDATIEIAHGLPAGAIRETAFAGELLDRAITGAITDEEWRETVALRLARRFPEATAAQAVALWSQSSGEIDTQVLQVLQDCASSLRIVLATNATTRLSRDLSALGIANRFHHIANSSRLGAIKPHAEFYRRALHLAGAAAAASIYIDDAHANIAAAATLGIASHLFTGPAPLREFLHRVDAIDAST